LGRNRSPTLLRRLADGGDLLLQTGIVPSARKMAARPRRARLPDLIKGYTAFLRRLRQGPDCRDRDQELHRGHSNLLAYRPRKERHAVQRTRSGAIRAATKEFTCLNADAK
jgi:hypothetical protein